MTDTRETDAFGLNVVVTGTTPTPFGFAGQSGYQSDSVTGLMRLGHRYYDASVGRFLSRDPIRHGYNWYTYVNNDPVNGVDPTGLIGEELIEEFEEYPFGQEVISEAQPYEDTAIQWTQEGLKEVAKQVSANWSKVRRIADGLDIRDVPRLVNQYGGNAVNWLKRSTEKIYDDIFDGEEIHWYENLRDGIGRKEFKIK